MLNIILDTDIGPDCDDAGALALINLYHRRGLVNVLAVTHCTSNPCGVGAIRCINDWYGNDFPVGTMSRTGFLCDEQARRYNGPLSGRLPESRRIAGDAVQLLRRTLASQADGSVDFITIGPLRNLADLLLSPADTDSPLDGAALMERKCARLTMMAGSFAHPEVSHLRLPAVEWNIEMDVDALHTVMERWHGPTAWLGWEAGIQVITGRNLRTLPDEHPVRAAYELHGSGDGRPSWDLLTVHHACVPENGLTRGERGIVRVGTDGSTTFTPDGNGRHTVIKLAANPEDIAAELDRWLVSE